MTSPFTEQYTGLWATPELVGRRNILDQFERILQDPSPVPHLVFLHGVGGIGKTRLLKKALEMARELNTCCVTDDVIDFYHISLHTPIGLTQAVFEILPIPFGYFKTYESAYSALNRARLSGSVVELSQLRDDATDKFDQDLKQLSATKRVVLALDTVERVVYGLPGWSDEFVLADSWDWLMKHLPTWQNVIVFVAGRDEAYPAIEKAKVQKAVSVDELEIGFFNLDESLKYFEEVALILNHKKEYQLAERLKNFPLDFKKGAHAYSEGRPILLSLLVDYLSFPGVSGEPFILNQALPAQITAEDKHRYEEDLLNRLREGELGETLIALGRVPKGADENMLAALLDISPVEARKRLADIRNISVVKIRPEDQRVFLHDEVYALLQRHVYDSPFDAEPQKKAFEAIKKYYQDQRSDISHRLSELYAPVEEYGRESLDLKALGEAHTQYQTHLAEIMYYFLCHDLGRGFRAYYRFSHEAIMARDILMDLHLQAELLSYLSRPPAPILERDGISVKMILQNLKTHLPARKWAMGKYGDGIDNVNEIMGQVKDSWQNEYPVLLAALHVWSANLHILRGAPGDYEEAEKHLELVYSLLPDEEVHSSFVDSLFPNTLLWYKKAITALSYRIHGYLKRVQGLMKAAVDEYQKAAVLLREIDLRVEMATTMNDMGFAQAEIGSWDDGRSNVKLALELRRELGARIPVALSLNTLAAIDVREGQHPYARQYSGKALSIFRAFSYQRGIGMALITLAEATRRYAGVTPLLSVDERIKSLREARDYAREASIIFEEINESSRRVEALIELGTAYRDWVRWLKEGSQAGDNPERLRRESQDALREAALLAKKVGLVYRHVDALVNLAWLEFYMLGKEETVPGDHAIWAAIHAAENAFPPDDEMKKQPQVWTQKGKICRLQGHLAYREFEQLRKEDTKGLSKDIIHALESIAEDYAYSLDFGSRFALDDQGIRQAKYGIYARLKLLNTVEMHIVCNQIQKLYPQGSAIQTFLFNRALWQPG